jgi:hypothetical protein
LIAFDAGTFANQLTSKRVRINLESALRSQLRRKDQSSPQKIEQLRVIVDRIAAGERPLGGDEEGGAKPGE